MVFHFQMRGNYPRSPHLAPKSYFVRNLINKTINPLNTGIENISNLAINLEDHLYVYQRRYGMIDWIQNIIKIRSFLASDIEDAKRQLHCVPCSGEDYKPNEYHILVLISNPFSEGIIAIEWLIRCDEEYFSDSDSSYFENLHLGS